MLDWPILPVGNVADPPHPPGLRSPEAGNPSAWVTSPRLPEIQKMPKVSKPHRKVQKSIFCNAEILSQSTENRFGSSRYMAGQQSKRMGGLAKTFRNAENAESAENT